MLTVNRAYKNNNKQNAKPPDHTRDSDLDASLGPPPFPERLVNYK